MKFQNFSIAKIEFLWRALNFKRGHGPPGPPFSAAYVILYVKQIIHKNKTARFSQNLHTLKLYMHKKPVCISIALCVDASRNVNSTHGKFW